MQQRPKTRLSMQVRVKKKRVKGRRGNASFVQPPRARATRKRRQRPPPRKPTLWLAKKKRQLLRDEVLAVGDEVLAVGGEVLAVGDVGREWGMDGE